jgi:hypothetical protein
VEQYAPPVWKKAQEYKAQHGAELPKGKSGVCRYLPPDPHHPHRNYAVVACGERAVLSKAPMHDRALVDELAALERVIAYLKSPKDCGKCWLSQTHKCSHKGGGVYQANFNVPLISRGPRTVSLLFHAQES